MPAAASREPTEVCPGCGAVLVSVADGGPVRPGASPSCSRLFEVTLRGPREETGTDRSAAGVVRLADDAYAAQHPTAEDPDRLRAALDGLPRSPGEQPVPSDARPPARWRTTIADVAADLDVIALPVLVNAWARAVREDWAAAARATEPER
jgi:hypothetical protein